MIPEILTNFQTRLRHGVGRRATTQEAFFP